MKDLIIRIKESRWTLILLPFIFLLAIVVIFTVMTNGTFIGVRNLNVIMQQAMIVGTVSTGACFIFATGNRNIAMGSCTALVAAIAALTYNSTQSIGIMFGVAILSAMAIMLICVMLSTILNVMVIHVTIVMMQLLRAIQSEIVGGGSISVPYEMTKVMNDAHVSEIIFFGFAAVCIILFHFTPIGRYIKMTGANRKSAALTGIRYKTALTITFLIAGVGAGLAALVTIFRTSSITSFTSSGLNTDVMLAIVLGGMPVYGGSKSKAYAPIIGAVTVTALNNGLLMVGVSNAIVQGVRGIIFLLLLLMGNKRTAVLPAREG